MKTLFSALFFPVENISKNLKYEMRDKYIRGMTGYDEISTYLLHYVTSG